MKRLRRTVVVARLAHDTTYLRAGLSLAGVATVAWNVATEKATIQAVAGR